MRYLTYNSSTVKNKSNKN